MGKWLRISWRRFSDKVVLTAKAMAEFGIRIQEDIGVYSQNMSQCLYTNSRAYDSRVTSIPMCATSSPGQIEYIASDVRIHTLFVGEQLQYNNALRVQRDSKYPEHLVVFDPAVKVNPEDKTSICFDNFLRLGDNVHAESTMKICTTEAAPEDLAIIIYTSGTIGESRGVMPPHSCYLEAMRIHGVRLSPVTDKDLSVNFLSVTHIFGKVRCYYCLHKGVMIAINQDPKMTQKTLPEVHPTLMCNVPYFWEEVRAGAHKKINSASPAIKKIFLDAIETGRKYNLEYKNKDILAPCDLRLEFQFYSKTVLTLLKRVLDIERGRFFLVAGAPLSDTVSEFLQSVNASIAYGYGPNETTATVCFYPEIGFQFGSIGEVMPGVRMKIDPGNNEILMKGKAVMSGYYNKPEETKRTFAKDDFLHTGDAGRLEGNTLFFMERIKDLHKTSGGRYIAPQAIEMVMSGDNYIEQIAVIDDQRGFASALTVLVYPLSEKYVGEKGISSESQEELVKNRDIIRFIETRVEEHQKNLVSYEKIKRFTLLLESFVIECELTDTPKLCHPIVSQKYATGIGAMYKK